MNAVSTPAGPPHSDGFEVREFAALLRRHRWFLALCLSLGLGVGWGLSALRAPAYEASTLFLVSGATPGLASLELTSSPVDERRVSTEMELLRSRALAKSVVDSLQLQLQVSEPRSARRGELFASIQVSPDAAEAVYRFRRQDDDRFAVVDDATGRGLGSFGAGEPIRLADAVVTLAPDAWGRDDFEIRVVPRADAVAALMESVEVEQPGQDASLIRLRYRGSDPALTRDVANALTERFIALRESMQKSEVRSTVTLLREQLDTLAGQLASSEDRLRQFRESAQVVDPQVEATTRIGHLADLQAQRALLDAERSSLAAVLAEVRAAEARARPGSVSPYRRLIAFPSLLRNPAASEMLRSLASVEDQRAELLTRRSAEDPDVRILSARVAELEAQLRGIATTYLDGLTNQVAALDATLRGYQAQLDRAPATEVEFARLSRRPRVLQEMYGVLQTRLKEAEIAEAVDNSSVRVVDAADLPSEPAGSHRLLLTGTAGVLGLMLGLGLVVAREYSDSTVRTRADVQTAIGIPVLGLIPQAGAPALPRGRLGTLPGSRFLLPARSAMGFAPARDGGEEHDVPTLIIRSDRVTPLSDAFSRLHANIMFARPDAEMKTLLLTSPLPGDGKTTTAVNFATSLAQCGLRVLLVDADLRRGAVHRLLGSERGPGLSDLLSDQPVFDGVLRATSIGDGERLRYITAGTPTINPVQVLSSPLMRELLEGAASEYDRVIIDSPPLNLFPDAAVLGGLVDGVLMVARAGVTPFDALVDAAEQLRQSSTPLVGAVLAGVDFAQHAGYDRYYRWQTLRETYHAAAAGEEVA